MIKRPLQRDGDRRAGTIRERSVVSQQGIKAGYVRVSSDRIKDGRPDPFSSLPIHTPDGCTHTNAHNVPLLE